MRVRVVRGLRMGGVRVRVVRLWYSKRMDGQTYIHMYVRNTRAHTIIHIACGSKGLQMLQAIRM